MTRFLSFVERLSSLKELLCGGLSQEATRLKYERCGEISLRIWRESTQSTKVKTEKFGFSSNETFTLSTRQLSFTSLRSLTSASIIITAKLTQSSIGISTERLTSSAAISIGGWMRTWLTPTIQKTFRDLGGKSTTLTQLSVTVRGFSSSKECLITSSTLERWE